MRSTDFPFAVMPQRLQRGGKFSVDYSAPSAALAAVRANDDQQFGGISAQDVSVRDQIKDKLAVIFGRRNADKLMGVGELVGVDAPLMLDEALLAYREGRPGEAAATAALAVLPIPGAAKKGAKAAMKGAAKVATKATSSAYSTPRQVIAKEFGRDIAQRLDGIVPADAPITEWRAAAENLSSPEVAKSNRRFTPEFKRPSEKPLATQMGEQGLPVRGMDLVEAQHPSPFGVFSKYKTPKDPLETEVVAEPYAVMPTDRRFDTSRLENARVVSLLADKSRAGDRLRSIDGFPMDVYTQGGPMHAALQEALGGSSAFANTGGGLTSLRKQIAAGLEEGRPVFGVTTTMGPSSLNQTVDMVDILHQMAQTSPISKSDLADFNEKARSLLPGYAGLLDEDAVRQLQGATQGQRKAFVKLMDNADALARGLPNVPAARFGLTDPNLVDVPSGVSGYSFVELGPESLQKLDSSIKNRSYVEDLTGKFGGRGPLVPFSTMFSDFIKERRAAGLPAGSDLRSLEFQKPVQDMTPEVYDRLMRYLSKIDDPY